MTLCSQSDARGHESAPERGRVLLVHRYERKAEHVFDLATELDKAVEIDGYPDRQDLNVDLLKLAKRCGCRISLGTDAHDPQQLRFMEYSLAAALLADIPRDRILNFMTADQVRNWAAALIRA